MAAHANNGDRRRGNPWLTGVWITVTAVILLTPLIAMQFTDDVNWTVSDFAFAGLLLVGSGMTYELAVRVGNLAYQAGVVAALAAVVLTIWVTGAVGIIGSEDNPGNLLYLGVVALALIGAALSLGRAGGMVWATAAAAVATMLVPAIAYYGGVADPTSDVAAPEVFGATAFFTALWLLSARLFWAAARAQR